MASTLSFRVEVAADQATQSLQVLSQAFNQAGITAKAALLKVGEGSKGAGAASSALEKHVRSLKSEMAAGDRTINFFARTLNSIVPEASAAGQGIRLLADGLIGGLGLGFAIQAAMAAVSLFGDSLKEQEESAKKAREAIQRYGESIQKAKLGIVGLVSGDAEAEREAHLLQMQELRFKRGIAEAHKQKEEVQRINNEMELMQQQFDLAQKTSQLQEQRKFEDSILDLRKETMTEEDKLWADANRRAARVALDSSHLTGQQQEQLQLAIYDDLYRRLNELREKYDFDYYADALKRAESFANQVRAKLSIQPLFPKKGYVFNPETGGYQEEKRGLYGIRGPHDLPPTMYPDVKFPGASGGLPTLEESQRVAENAKSVAGAFANEKEIEARTKALVTTIATTWAEGLGQMAADTDLSAKSMVRIFAQMMAQIVAAALPASMGPWGAVLGAFTGGFAARLPSSAGGQWRVPSDTLAAIHKDETIIPAPEARGLRQLIASGGGGGSGITVNVNGPMDGLSVERVLVGNDGALARANRKMRRRMRG